MEAGIHELTPGYALDALDPEERSAYEAHLAGCERCQRELASFWETTEALAIAASGPAPSLALRERILAQARAEPQVVVPLERPGARRTAPVLAAVAAVAAVVALAVGLWATQPLERPRRGARRARARAAQRLPCSPTRTRARWRSQEGAGRLVVGLRRARRPRPGRARPRPFGEDLRDVDRGGRHSRSSRASSPAATAPRSSRSTAIVDGGDVVAVTLVEPRAASMLPTTAPIVASDPV